MPGWYAALQTHQLVVFRKLRVFTTFPTRLVLGNANPNGSNLLPILAEYPGVLVTIIVVYKGNLGIMEERSSKNQGMLAVIENEKRLVVNYASNIDLNIFACSIEHLGVSRNYFQSQKHIYTNRKPKLFSC